MVVTDQIKDQLLKYPRPGSSVGKQAGKCIAREDAEQAVSRTRCFVQRFQNQPLKAGGTREEPGIVAECSMFMRFYIPFSILTMIFMDIKNQISVDFLFIGLGAANCLLLLKMSENNLLSNKKIAVIEPHSKNTNDRTFCFWATQEELLKLKIEDLVSSTWNQIKVNGMDKQSITPLNYYHVKGIDLYNKAKNELSREDTIFFATTFDGAPLIKSNSFEIHLNDAIVTADKVFDSRPPVFAVPQKNQSHLYQSFIGWEIEASTRFVDTSTVVMMDFDIPQNNCCQFMYVLPFAENAALFEVTRFGTDKIEREEAEKILKDYIAGFVGSYRIVDEEKGVIPMSSANMDVENHGPNWIYTGSRANMIKSSTGYGFHSMALDALHQVEAMKNNESYKRKTQKTRFNFYDRLLLKILEQSPRHGKRIFQSLFNHVSISDVLLFLREQSAVRKEFFIFSKLPTGIFIQAAFKDVMYQISMIPPSVSAFLFTAIALILSLCGLESLLWVFLGTGFLTIGLSHGAVDHLTDQNITDKNQLFKFIIHYLLKGVLLGMIWLIFPDLALAAFIAYSAWHFGQADFNEWNLKQGVHSFFWGLAVLLTILVYHFEETVAVLTHIPGLQIVSILETCTSSQILYFKFFTTLLSLVLVVYNKSKYMILTLAYLLISSMLPLLLSFGIYFVGQHSFHGWRHLKTALKTNSCQLWLKSLPFSIAGALLISFFMLTNNKDYVGIFFILLSCISIPHVISMDHFYRKMEK